MTGTLSAAPGARVMAYRIAGIDVHKRLLAVVVADVAGVGEFRFERRMIRTSPDHLRALAEWLVTQEVEEVVMESTAQYWRPVWETLERAWQPHVRARVGAGPLSGALHLAQAQSNQGARGRKRDFPDAERLVKRLVAQELTLSFVPSPASASGGPSRVGSTNSPARACSCRTGLRHCSKRRISSSRVWSQIYWDRARGACSMPSPRVPPILPRWPRLPINGCARPPRRCATRSAPAATCIRSTGAFCSSPSMSCAGLRRRSTR